MKRSIATLIAIAMAAALCGAAQAEPNSNAKFLDFNIALFSNQHVSGSHGGILDFNISAFSHQHVSGPAYGFGNVNVAAFSNQQVGPSHYYGSYYGRPHHYVRPTCTPVVYTAPVVYTQPTCYPAAPAVTYQTNNYYQGGSGYGASYQSGCGYGPSYQSGYSYGAPAVSVNVWR